MACIIQTEQNIENKVKTDTKFIDNSMPYRMALKEAAKYNAKVGYKVLDVYTDNDMGTMRSISIPKEMVQYYFQLEKTKEENEARDVLKEDAERAGITEEQFTDRYLYEDPSETLDNPIDIMDRDVAEAYQITQEAQQAERDREVAIKLADKFTKSFGIGNEIISRADARSILEGSATPYNNEAAFFYNNKVYFVEGNFNSDAVLHEYAHPFIKAIQIQNPKLFEKLYLQLEQSVDGKNIIEELNRENELTGDNIVRLEPGSERFKEEAIVRAIELDGNRKINKIKSDDGSFKEFIKNALYAIKQVLRKFAKKLNLTKLDTDTTIGELTDILIGQDFVIDTTIIQPSDFAEFKKDFDKMLKEFGKIEGSKVVSITNDYFALADQQVKDLRNSPKKLKEALKGKEGDQLLTGLRANLQQFQTRTDAKIDGEIVIDALNDHVENNKLRARGLLESIDQTEIFVRKMDSVLTDMKKSNEHLKDLGLAKLQYYTEIIGQQRDFFENNLLPTLSLDPGNRLAKRIESVNSLARDVLKRIRTLQFESIVEYLKDNSETMNASIVQKLKTRLKLGLEAENFSEQEIDSFINKILKTEGSIDKYGENDLESALGRLPANSKHLINAVQEFSTAFISKDKLKAILKGEGGDMGTVSSNILAYTNINDPSIAFVMGMKRSLTEAANKSQQEENAFIESIAPLLKQVGYNPNDTRQLQDLMYFKDVAGMKDRDGNWQEYEVYTLLNKFKEWRRDLSKLQNDLEVARENKDNTAVQLAQDALWEFKEKYMHREYTDEFYEAQKLWRQDNTVTDPATGRSLNVDRQLSLEAYQERAAVLAKIGTYSNSLYTDLDAIMPYSELDAANQEYQQLYNLIDDNGNHKTGDELKKTLLRLKHREVTNDFYTYDVNMEKAQEDLDNFVNILLEGSDITMEENPEEFSQRLQEFLDKNYRIAYSTEYYDRVNYINEQINKLTSKGGVSDVAKKLQSLYKSRSLQLKVVSKDGVPDGSNLTEGQLNKLKETEKEITKLQEEYDTKTGLTREELNTLYKYFEMRRNKQRLSPEQFQEYTRLVNIRNDLGLTKVESTLLTELFQQKSELVNSVPTVEYLALFTNIAGTAIADLKDAGGLADNDTTEINFLNADSFVNNPIIEKLRESNKVFKSWFDKNHIKKKVKGKETYVRLSAWTARKPADSKFYQKTKLVHPVTGETLMINGKPGSRYTYRTVKDKYRTIPADLTAEQRQKYVGTIIDNKGNYLPKEYTGTAEGAYDAKYKNQKYYDLRASNNPQFRLIEEFTDRFLDIQKDTPYSSRLYLDQPRFRRRDTMEYLQSGQAGESIASKVEAIKSLIDSGFKKSVDDSDTDNRFQFNFDPETQLVQTDVSGQPMSRIPVRGIYRLDANDVSPDVLQGMSQYLFSVNEQQALIDNEPLAKALSNVLNDEQNFIKDVSKASSFINKTRGLTSFVKKGSENKRAKAMDYYIDRLFYGQVNSDFIEDNPKFTKVVHALMGAASRSFIALDASSALKNRFGMTFQKMVESVGGEYITPISMAKGKQRAFTATVALSAKDIYKRGAKSIDTQLMEVFDAVPGKFRKDFGKSNSRTFVKDMVNGSFMYDFRQLTEVNASLELFWGMMYNKLIPQTQSDGSVKQIMYADAWEIDADGQLKLKDGIDLEYNYRSVKHEVLEGESLNDIAEEYGVSVEDLKTKNKIDNDRDLEVGEEVFISKADKFKDFRFRVASVNQNLNGQYDQFEGSQAGKYLIFRAFSFYRKFALGMFLNRFQYNQKENNKFGEVYDWNAGDTKKGFYVSALQSGYKLLTDYQHYAPIMTKQEKGAVRKTLVEGLGFMAMALALTAIFGYEGDDADRFDKLKERQKTWGGWMANQMLYLTIMTKRENEMFNPVFGYSEMSDLLENSTIATGPTIKLYGKIFQDIIYWATDNEKAYYKQDVGPYSWQEKGEFKLWNHLGSIFGLKGKNYDPIWAIRKAEMFENLK